MAELAREEVAAQSQLLEDLARQLKVLLLPRDPLDERNIMLEVRRLVFWLHAAISMVKPYLRHWAAACYGRHWAAACYGYRHGYKLKLRTLHPADAPTFNPILYSDPGLIQHA